MAGYQSLETGNLISPASQFWTAGPSVRWRLLEYPRLRAQVLAQTRAPVAAVDIKVVKLDGLVDAVKAHCAAFMVSTFVTTVREVKDPAVAAVLTKVFLTSTRQGLQYIVRVGGV